MEKPIDDENLQRLQDEIRNRVLEAYAEKQGIQNQQHEIESTLEALKELTNLPASEIERIAQQVKQEHQEKKQKTVFSSLKKHDKSPSKIMDEMRWRLDKKRRGFFPHLVAFVAVNAMLTITNMNDGSYFPWAMFPFFGWSIGLASHFLFAVFYPTRDFNARHRAFEQETDLILAENLPNYPAERDRLLNGVLRMLFEQCTQETLESYLLELDANMDNGRTRQVSIQLMQLRESMWYTLQKRLATHAYAKD